MPDDRGRLGEIETLALRQAFDDVDQHDVGEAGFGDALRGRGADVARADDGDLVPGHAEGKLLSIDGCRLIVPRAALLRGPGAQAPDGPAAAISGLTPSA